MHENEHKRYLHVFAFLLLITLACLVRLDIRHIAQRISFVWSSNVIYGTCKDDEVEEQRRKVKGNYGKWVKYMPEFSTAIKKIDELDHFPDYDQTTSAERSEIRIITKQYHVDENLKAKITTRNHKNNRKLYGGDYFKVSLFYNRSQSSFARSKVPSNYRSFHREDLRSNVTMPCYVTYNISSLDYDVTCPLKIAGIFEMKAILLAPCEALYLIMLSTLSDAQNNVYVNTSFVNSENETEYSQCAMGFDDVSTNNLCNYSNPAYGEPWYCIKPPSNECNPIQSQWKVRLNKHQGMIGNDYLKGLPPEGRGIHGSGVTVIVTEEADVFSASEPAAPCFETMTSKNEPALSGWLQDDQWHASWCQNEQLNRLKLRKCLQNTKIFFIGDSVIQRWFSFFMRLLAVRASPQRRVSWSQGRDVESTRFGVKLLYRSHGPPLYSQGNSSFRPYITSSLHNIEEQVGKQNIVLISIGEHFTWINPDKFLQRVRAIKIAVKKLKKRLPTTKVFIKGMHTKFGFTNGWLSYRVNSILKAEFGDEDGITLLDVWTMSVVMDNQHTHPDDRVLFQQIAVFQSIMCS